MELLERIVDCCGNWEPDEVKVAAKVIEKRVIELIEDEDLAELEAMNQAFVEWCDNKLPAYAVVNFDHDGNNEWVAAECTNLKDAIKEWDDFNQINKRDNNKQDAHIVYIPDWESGNYEYLDEDLKWYAVMANDEDDDWGTGSFFLDEAQEKLKSYPNGYIAVIQNDVCIDEIRG